MPLEKTRSYRGRVDSSRHVTSDSTRDRGAGSRWPRDQEARQPQARARWGPMADTGDWEAARSASCRSPRSHGPRDADLGLGAPELRETRLLTA